MKRDSLPSIGAPLQGGFFGGVIAMAGVLYAIAWAPKATGETTGPWLKDYATVAGCMSCCDSLTNTLAMAEAGSPLAKWALGLDINGFDDWCLPSRDVLELGYRHLKPGTHKTGNWFRDGDNPSSVPVGYPYATGEALVQTAVQPFQVGGAEAFEEDALYWSSTQYSERNAWNQNFNNGNQNNNDKKFEGRARAVRLIQLTA